MDRLNFPPGLAYAMLEAQANCKADFHFQGVEVCGAPWDRCVRAGSVEAPLGWICEFIVRFGDLCQSWYREGVGIPLTAQTGYRTFSHALWAYNVILGSMSIERLRAMIHDMSVALYSRCYSWKPRSLQYFFVGFQMPMSAPLEVTFRVPLDALSDQVKRRRVDEVCSTLVSLQQVPQITIRGLSFTVR
ncbi:unnamed protein product [Prorocentrum cordatum]|uniref:Uncharacterized protein n=1 Tax=Prorocentrum cordatum TaxID=2364126 RepID=A0ABN9UI39_9DINO|nr:unnamed protein product [Polarella glacialis]